MNFKGQILLNPVDGGYDFSSMTPYFVITPGEKVNFTVPTLEISAGYDTIPSSKQGIIRNYAARSRNIDCAGTSGYACAPEEFTGKRFYDAMTGPTWFINATAYGHGDFLDPAWELVIEITKFCQTDPSIPKEDYINFVAGQIVAFILGVVDPAGNCRLFDYLETDGILNIETLNEFTDNGWDRCSQFQCINL